jgi:hypothetical protein
VRLSINHGAPHRPTSSPTSKASISAPPSPLPAELFQQALAGKGGAVELTLCGWAKPG